MRKFTLYLLSFCFGLALMFMNVFAVNSYPTAITPKVEVKINIGQSSLSGKDSFIEDLKTRLAAKGIDVSKLNVVKATNTVFNPADSSQWFKYDHIGSQYGEMYDSTNHYLPVDSDSDKTNDPHIITRADGTLVFYGYGAPAFKDFLISKDDVTSSKTFTFTLNEAAVDYHSMEGGGFLFGVARDDKGTASITDDTMSGYAILFVEQGTSTAGIRLYKLTDVNINNFHEATGSSMSSFASEIASYRKEAGTSHAVKIEIDTNNKLILTDNNVVKTPTGGEALPTVYGNRFGPLVSYTSHGCSTLSYFIYTDLSISTQIISSSLVSSIDEVSWEESSKRFLINLDDVEAAAWTADNQATMVTELQADSVYYVPVGISTSQSKEATVVTNNIKGQYFDSTTPTYTDLVQSIADYIFNQVSPTIIENAKTYAEDNVDETAGLVDFNFDGDETFTPNNTTVSNLISSVSIDDSSILNRDNVEIKITILALDEASVPSSDLANVQSYINQITDTNIGYQYVEINLNKYINAGSAVAINETNNQVTITLPIPADLQSYTNFMIVRVHNGVQSTLSPTYNATAHTLTFQTDKFSTYAMLGSNSALPTINESSDTTSTYVTPTEPSGNQAPSAKNFKFDTPKSGTFSGRVSGTDPEKDTVWYQLLGTGSTHGSLVFSPDGSFSFTPDGSNTGPAYFSYQICDTWKCSPAYSVTLSNTSGLPDTGIVENYAGLSLVVGVLILIRQRLTKKSY